MVGVVDDLEDPGIQRGGEQLLHFWRLFVVFSTAELQEERLVDDEWTFELSGLSYRGVLALRA